MSTKNLSLQIAVAEKAVELHGLEQTLRTASMDLREACADFRAKHNRGEYIPRESEVYEQMRDATGLEFEAYSEAKRNVRNAKRRLDTAVRKLLEKEGRP